MAITAIIIALLGGVIAITLSLKERPFSKEIYLSTPRWVNMMTGNISLNYTEVERFNISLAEMNLSAIDAGIQNRSIETGYYRYYFIFIPKNRSYDRFHLDIIANNITTQAWMDISYLASFPETQLQKEKEFASNKVKEIATVCGLNVIIWDDIWSITYQD